MSAVGVVGPGRVGTALALALRRLGYDVAIHGRRGKALPPPLSLTWGDVPPWLAEVSTVLVTVPDPVIADVAERLASSGAIGGGHVVLHCSGLLDRSALAPLDASGAALGSMHPLKSFADPVAASESLDGTLAAVEGDERAVARATALATALGMRPHPIRGDRKPVYHAAAVFAANYPVTLLAAAERLCESAGLARDAARAGLGALSRGVVENAMRLGPDALTGPIARGDVETVRRHLAALGGADAALYRALGRATLDLAHHPPEVRRALEEALAEP